MPKKTTGYLILLIASIVFTLAAVSTIIPQATASKASMLGYKAHCSFTPISTVMCLMLAGMSCKLRVKNFKE